MSERSRPEFLEFESRADASDALANELARILEEAVRSEGSAAIVVSGGSSPAPMFRALRGKPLPWNRVTVVPSDEREVPADHPDRNDAMIRRELLAGGASEASLAGLIPPGNLPGRFDAVVLGMGGDGHTASLFPGSPDLGRALESRGPLERLEVPQLGAHRVSLTPAVLLSCDRVFLLFFGNDKRTVFDRAARGTDVEEFPVRSVLNQDRVPVTVYWAP